MFENSLLQHFEKMVAGTLDNNGVFPHILIFEKSDSSIQKEFINLSEPYHVLCHCLNRLVEERPKYLVFGLDRYAMPDQGVNTTDFLSFYFWDDGAWRFGIIEYQDEKIVGTRWDCTFWNNKQELEIKQALGSLLRVKV